MTERRPPAASPLARDDEIEVAIEKLVAGGDGLGRHEGLPIFVPRAAPGDRLRVRIVERRPSYARAEVSELLAPGPGRREPRCRHFGECGGCDLQHLDYEAQLESKVVATVETLARLGKIELPVPRIVAGDAWGYRTRTQLHSEPAGEGRSKPLLGYHARGSHRVVVVEECPVLAPELETAVRRLPAALGDTLPPRIDLCVGDGASLSVAPPIAGMPHGAVRTRVGGFDYAFDAGCFFQGHRGLLPQLVEAVVGNETGGLAVDLYAGVGLFALPLAGRFERVVAVEGDRLAARYGRINARRNGAENVVVVHQAVETWIPTLAPSTERVVVDPPRAGLASRVAGALLARAPRRLTYVSCHPATLARDLARLSECYTVSALVLVDMFPQTGHIEAVAQLTRR